MSTLTFNRAAARWSRIVIAATLGITSTASHAFSVFTVGTDGACSHTTIQAAIAAAAAEPGPNTIFVTNELSYAHQEIIINDQELNLIGGHDTCTSTGPGANLTTISAADGHSVIAIGGTSNVYLAGFVLTGANLSSANRGGGIYFGGVGSLELAGMAVTANSAGYGGGIAMNPSGPSTLTLLSTVVNLNTALNNGGGLRIEGPTTFVTDGATFITTNHALGQDDTAFGGGVLVVGPATATINSSVNNNTAAYGGGIAVLGHDGDAASASLYSVNAASPVSVYGNSASANGGGVYLKSSGSGALAVACAQDFSFQFNSAQSGAAIYADVNNGHGSAVELNGPFYCAIPSGAVPCAEGVSCNEIVDNVSQDTNGNSTAGATVLIESGGEFSGLRFAARRNHGGSLIQFVADTGTSPGGVGDDVYLYDCLLADNVASGSPGTLIEASGGHAQTQLLVKNCTIANNQLDAASVIHAGVDFAIVTDSIVYQPASQATLDFSGAADHLTTAYVLSNETGSLGGGTGISQGAPTFVDAANHDYHLARTSLGVDYAPAQAGMDLDGLPRTIDLSDITDTFGPLDLGAYEIQTQLPPSACAVADTIFCNGFEP